MKYDNPLTADPATLTVFLRVGATHRPLARLAQPVPAGAETAYRGYLRLFSAAPAVAAALAAVVAAVRDNDFSAASASAQEESIAAAEEVLKQLDEG